MMTRFDKGLGSANYPNDLSLTCWPKEHRLGQGGKHVILSMHGRNGDPSHYGPAYVALPGIHTPELVDAGNIVLSVDANGPVAWGDPDSLSAMDDWYAWCVANLNMPTAKIGIQAWSMQCLSALTWAHRNQSKIAGMWLWSAVTDLRYYRDAAGAYTPTYSVGGAGAQQGAYTTEINNIYAGSTTAVGTATIPASGGAGVTVNVANARSFSDSSTLGGAALAQATASGVAFTYTGKTNTSLLGCVSTTAGTIAITNGLAITSSYATQSPAYNPWALAPTGFTVASGYTVPTKLVQGTSDNSVPPDMNIHASTGFVARANNVNITLRSPNPAVGHAGVFDAVPASEVVSFFAGLSW